MISPRVPHKNLSIERLAKLKGRLARVRLVVIDEISMVSPTLLACIDARLRQATGRPVAFGRICVLACGDFFQIRPVGGQTLLEASLDVGKKAPKSEWAAAGAVLWQKFCLLQIDKQMRAAACATQALLVRRIRDEHRISPDLFDMLRPLTPTDFENEPIKWSMARFISCFNSEVDEMNKVMMCNFSKRTRQKVFFWKNEFPKLDKKSTHLLGERFRSFGWFCRGAPAIFVSNVETSAGIVNGGAAESLEALVFDPPRAEYEALFNPMSEDDEEFLVEVDIPAAVIVTVSTRGCSGAPSLEGGISGRSIVVPLKRIKMPFDICTMKGREVKTDIIRFPYDLGFACTYHRCQGQTLPAVVVSFRGKPTFEMILVALSRVTAFDNLRCMRGDIGTSQREKEHVTSVTPSKETLQWLRGTFDSNGKRKYL